MKCKYCDGTGTSNICVNGTFKPCSFCDGTGEFDPNEVDRFNAVDFIKVMEMVKKPMTNEEWLKQCTTEQLANVFFEYRYANATPRQKLWMSASEKCIKTDIVEWLKQLHKE